ncbi:MAG: hypothetical protein FWC11_03200 [Firmicutes bacterium]|nr:hypothetical protein [Bacillota bacterium]MCL2255848.1 hypothetical protein [Bacillota bacterium]
MNCPKCFEPLKKNYCKYCDLYIEEREVSDDNIVISTGHIEHRNSSPFDDMFGGGIFGGLSSILNELVFGFDIHAGQEDDPFDYVELIESASIIEIDDIEKFSGNDDN